MLDPQGNDAPVGFLFLPASGRFAPDRARARLVSDADLRARGDKGEGDGEGASALTFTLVPPGSGRRIGIDRDLDGVLDGDEQVRQRVSSETYE